MVVFYMLLIKSIVFILKLMDWWCYCVIILEMEDVMIWLVLDVIVIVGGIFVNMSSGVIRNLLLMLNIFDKKLIVLFRFKNKKIFIESFVIGR